MCFFLLSFKNFSFFFDSYNNKKKMFFIYQDPIGIFLSDFFSQFVCFPFFFWFNSKSFSQCNIFQKVFIFLTFFSESEKKTWLFFHFFSLFRFFSLFFNFFHFFSPFHFFPLFFHFFSLLGNSAQSTSRTMHPKKHTHVSTSCFLKRIKTYGKLRPKRKLSKCLAQVCREKTQQAKLANPQKWSLFVVF